MSKEKDLVFNPVKYAEICAKKDAKERAQRNRENNKYFGCYYNERSGYGKIWESVNDYYSSREW